MGEAKRRGRDKAVYKSELIRASRHAYKKQGLAAFEVTERATALHEAGHAVVALSIAGEIPETINLEHKTVDDPVAGPMHRLGECTYAEGSLLSRTMDVRVSPIEDVFAVCVHMIAGQAAEFMCDRDDYREGSSLNETVQAGACLLGLGDFRLGLGDNGVAIILLAKTVAWRALERNREAVERLAAALIERCSLKQAEIADLLAGVVILGKPTADHIRQAAENLIKQADGNVRAYVERLAGEVG